MDYHHHARLTIYSRERLAKSVVQGRLSLCEAAAEHRLSRQTAAKWVQAIQDGRHGWSGGPQLASTPVATAHFA